MTRDEVMQKLNACGYDNGNKFRSPADVRDYFNVAVFQQCFGECTDSQDDLNEMAECVIEHELHCEFRVSLFDFNNVAPITYLWIYGVGYPGGKEFAHDIGTDDEEDYCDFAELKILDKLFHLHGTVDKSGTWCWDGVGNVYDDRGNTIQNVKASR